MVSRPNHSFRGSAIGQRQTAIGNRCSIHGSIIERSVVMEGTETAGPVELTDSIVGRTATTPVGAARTVCLSAILGDAR